MAKYLNIDQNAKTVKGNKRGYITGVLYLAPSTESGTNVCPFASKGCSASCLYTAGMGIFKSVQKSRIAKTLRLFKDRVGFLAQIEKDIVGGIKRAKQEGKKFVVRLNGTSDLPVETWGFMDKFKDIQFYDYTKHPSRMRSFLEGRMPKNYHLTFSLSEDNESVAKEVLKHGGNVAVVFKTKDEKSLPKTFWDFKVINGDLDDLRFKDPKNVIVGLKMKGKAIHDISGFVKEIA